MAELGAEEEAEEVAVASGLELVITSGAGEVVASREDEVISGAAEVTSDVASAGDEEVGSIVVM